jgi:hypothetical protein
MCQSSQVQLTIPEDMEFEEFEKEICKRQLYTQHCAICYTLHQLREIYINQKFVSKLDLTHLVLL